MSPSVPAAASPFFGQPDLEATEPEPPRAELRHEPASDRRTSIGRRVEDSGGLLKAMQTEPASHVVANLPVKESIFSDQSLRSTAILGLLFTYGIVATVLLMVLQAAILPKSRAPVSLIESPATIAGGQAMYQWSGFHRVSPGELVPMSS